MMCESHLLGFLRILNINCNSSFKPHLRFCHYFYFENATEGQYPNINDKKGFKVAQGDSDFFHFCVGLHLFRFVKSYNIPV